MAFVRRKGNAFYLVHNVRRGGKVRQLHLARLGDRARITERVVRVTTAPCGRRGDRETRIKAAAVLFVIEE